MPRQIELIHHMQESNEGVLNNYIPFKSIFYSVLDVFRYGNLHNFIYQVMGNVILFMPLGFSIKFFMQDKKAFLRSLISIAFISCSIESFQALANVLVGVNYRSVDIDDIILNVAGGLLGYLIAKYAQKWILSMKQKKPF
jgi:glycopeptide antibiotics resistance protein